MAGGTRIPPLDSRCEPWSKEGKSKDLVKEKESFATRAFEVSLDRADNVIEGGPRSRIFWDSARR